MFFWKKKIEPKKIEVAIREWKEDRATKISILPFQTYSIKGGNLYAAFTAFPSALRLRRMQSRYGVEGGYEMFLEEEKDELKSVGRFYSPNRGMHVYTEQKNPEQPLSNLQSVVEILRNNRLKADVASPLKILGIKVNTKNSEIVF